MNTRVRFVNPELHFKRYGKEIMAALKDRLARGELILRDDVTNFEKNLATMCGTKYAVGVNSGFDAIFLSLEAAGVGRGDEVITVAHTFLATIAAIVKLGATPVLVDVGEDWNMDVALVQKAITPRTKAIIPVHLNGRMCDMTALMKTAKKHKLLVIEDACQSLTATCDRKKAGSFGLTGCFSFYPFKILGAFGEAGAVVTNDAKLRDKLILLRYHGVDRTPERKIHTYGWNAVLDNIQAVILNAKLPHFSEWIKRRKQIAAMYTKSLKKTEGLKLPYFPDKRFTDIYQNYVIQTPRRDELRTFLTKKGVETLISWPTPLHKYPQLGLHASLPKTEQASREVLSLPLYPELADKEVAYVIDSVKSYFARS